MKTSLQGLAVPSPRGHKKVAAIRSSTFPAPLRDRWVLFLAAVDEFTRGLRTAAGRRLRLPGRSARNPAAHDRSPHNHSRPKSQDLLGGAGLRFYHRADCPMAVERDWPTATADEHTLAERVPCGMCTP